MYVAVPNFEGGLAERRAVSMSIVGKWKRAYEMFRLLTLTEEQRAPGEQSRLATTAFSLPEEVPEMLQDGRVSCGNAEAVAIW